MPFVKPQKMIRQEARLEYGDYISIELWDNELSKWQMDEIAKLARKLYEIIDIKSQYVSLIQIGPMAMHYPREEKQDAQEREGERT